MQLQEFERNVNEHYLGLYSLLITKDGKSMTATNCRLYAEQKTIVVSASPTSIEEEKFETIGAFIRKAKRLGADAFTNICIDDESFTPVLMLKKEESNVMAVTKKDLNVKTYICNRLQKGFEEDEEELDVFLEMVHGGITLKDFTGTGHEEYAKTFMEENGLL